MARHRGADLGLVVSLLYGGERRFGFYGMFVTDAFALFMKALVLIGSAVTILMGMRYNEDQGIARFEFPVLVLLSTIGMMVMISANDLITLYVGLELQNLALYVVASFNRDFGAIERGRPQIFRARRAVFGNAALRRVADLRLYRHDRFTEIATLVAGGAAPSTGVVIGLVFVVVGLAFKVSAVPFHMWTPDVYEGRRPRLPRFSRWRRKSRRWRCLFAS